MDIQVIKDKLQNVNIKILIIPIVIILIGF
jgi:hypothetical protein